MHISTHTSTMTSMLVILLLVPLLLSACRPIQAPQTAAAPTREAPQKLLFVGNSFTFVRGGLENHVKALAASATPPRIIQADSSTEGGATLKILYKLGRVHDMIRDGGYDMVILQEDIPELTEHNVAPFFEHARLFNQEIKQAGSETAFFMTWPYERLNWVTLEEIAQAHRDIGAELDAPVAPVGLAFARALAERPDMAMLDSDKEHETMRGMYLAANVIYATLYGENPQGLPYRPDRVSEEEAAFLQRIAWETVQDWQSTRDPSAAP